ncbi:hypothetical protein GRI42_06005 [Erythrobacter gaetbuli]|uniref:Uncharacterized protein n=1 Tax=Qipengyuania gaetbuli TaxID=266952 RepID=A0A844Y142_9SPHN|nr:hypothetical protein [Qipengyuania gaetbuli]MXO50858.1 hypothetical protein [Qipengyuania gaetbuli]
MKRMLGLAAVAAIASQAAAHPTGIPYETRGECEAAYAEFSKLDRERLSGLGFTPGDAQKTFRDMFLCIYDQQADKWFIVRVGDM